MEKPDQAEDVAALIEAIHEDRQSAKDKEKLWAASATIAAGGVEVPAEPAAPSPPMPRTMPPYLFMVA